MVKETPGTTETPASERGVVVQTGAGLSRSNIFGLAATALALLALMAVLVVRLQQANQAVSSAPAYPLVGHAAPDFTAPVWNGASGQTVQLADLKGKPVILNWPTSPDDMKPSMTSLVPPPV